MPRQFKNARKINKLKVVDAAERLCISQPTLSAWENGRKTPTLDNLEKMADLYGVTTDFLLNDNEDVFFSQEAKNSDPFDKFYGWVESLPAKLAPFFRKYGWIGGILLIIIGVYRLVSVVAGLLMMGNVPLGATGMTIPFLLTWFINGAVGVAIIVAGVIIIKKFRPEKNKTE